MKNIKYRELADTLSDEDSDDDIHSVMDNMSMLARAYGIRFNYTHHNMDGLSGSKSRQVQLAQDPSNEGGNNVDFSSALALTRERVMSGLLSASSTTVAAVVPPGNPSCAGSSSSSNSSSNNNSVDFRRTLDDDQNDDCKK